MSPSSFSRFFKARTGRSISDYVIGIRLSYAARELVGTTRPIAEICFASGFNNVSNFNRIFKKNKGITPKESREIYKRNKILISSTKPTSETGYNSGCNNVLYFNRIFKKTKGFTPKEFREIYKRNKILI